MSTLLSASVLVASAILGISPASSPILIESNTNAPDFFPAPVVDEIISNEVATSSGVMGTSAASGHCKRNVGSCGYFSR